MGFPKCFFWSIVIIMLCTSTLPCFAFEDFWQQTNGPFGGDIQALIINSSDHIFAGTWEGGVVRSTDNGVNWTAVNNGLTQRTVYALALNSIGHILAGTYGGIFRSTDNGENWMEVNTGTTHSV